MIFINLPDEELITGDCGRDFSKHWKRVLCVNFIFKEKERASERERERK